MRVLLVIPSEAALPAIAWARRIATASGGSLSIVCPKKDSADRLQEANSAGDDSPPGLAGALDAAKEGSGAAAVYDCRAASVYRGVVNAARELDADLLVLPARFDDGESGAEAAIKRLARAAPYDVLVLDAAGDAEPPRRILVPQFDGGGAHALSFAARVCGGGDRPIMAFPDPKMLPRSRRVFARAQERAAGRKVSLTQSAGDAAPDEALRAELAPGDFVLFDAESPERTARLLASMTAIRSERRDVSFAIGVTRAEEAAGATWVERIVERMRRHAPVLTRDERRDLHELLEKGGRLSTNFVVMLSLSAAIAALGLIQSSASVVIGAMLVAPLMTPLVAIGMSLAQGNVKLFRAALRAMALGVLGALAVSMLVGLVSPWHDLSSEVVARGSPNVFDLLIAFLSGVAASFALARPDLAGTLVGVAIAVALVPPLATVGIAAVKAHGGVAFGASVLFLTNLLAIILGSALVFRLFGVDPSSRGARTPMWVRIALGVIAAGLLVTTVVLVDNLTVQTKQGVHRPYARPLPPEVRRVVADRVAREPGLDIVFMAQSDIEHGFGVEIVLSAAGGVSPGLTSEIRALVEDELNEEVPVRVLIVRGVLDSQANPVAD